MRRFDRLHQIALASAEEPAASRRAEADTLCDELRKLFCNDIDCLAYQLDVRVIGSVCNNTHLPTSDADIAVIPTGCRTHPRPGKGPIPSQACDPLGLRNVLLTYLKTRYGERLACQQRKAILLCGEAGRRTQADIVVLIPRLWQHSTCSKCGEPQCSHGYELRSTCDREMPIATWPEQHRENAIAFNLQTQGYYKRAVRAAKGILRSDIGDFPVIAPCLPPVLIEHLFARVPAKVYSSAGSCPYAVMRAAIRAVHNELWVGTAYESLELSGMRKIFDPVQTWTHAQVRTSISQMNANIP